MTDLSSETPEIQKRVWHNRELRAHVINSDDALRARARAGYYEYEQVIATGWATTSTNQPTRSSHAWPQSRPSQDSVSSTSPARSANARHRHPPPSSSPGSTASSTSSAAA